MPIEIFLVVVYCHVCEALQAVIPGGNPRRRGFPPKLSDAEALTMAFVGTFLGYRSDKAVWEYFRRGLDHRSGHLPGAPHPRLACSDRGTHKAEVVGEATPHWGAALPASFGSRARMLFFPSPEQDRKDGADGMMIKARPV